MVKIVVNDVKKGKSYQKEVDLALFSGKKIGDKFSGDVLGLKDYELLITGGSDSAGFPLNNSFDSPVRKKILIKGKKGIMRRKNVRGNQFGSYTAQISLKVVKYGSGDLSKLVGVEKKEEGEEKETKEKKVEEKPVEKPKKEEKPKSKEAPKAGEKPKEEKVEEKPKPEEKPKKEKKK